jgi:hypothetical protein
VVVVDYDFSAAKSYLEKSISLYTQAFNYLNLGVMLTHKDDYMEARSDFNKTLKNGVIITNTEAFSKFTLL